MRPILGSALHIDSRPAFLFQCGDTNLCAITLDGTGVNLPRNRCERGWVLCQKFPLGVREPVPAAVTSEVVLAGILANGWYVWRDSTIGKRS